MSKKARTRHQCDETCVCPVHRTPFWYAPRFYEHACQDPGCVYAHGFEGSAYPDGLVYRPRDQWAHPFTTPTRGTRD